MNKGNSRAFHIGGYINAEKAAEQTGYSYSHFTRKLKKGHVPGAMKFGYAWLVPERIKREDIHNQYTDYVDWEGLERKAEEETS